MYLVNSYLVFGPEESSCSVISASLVASVVADTERSWGEDNEAVGAEDIKAVCGSRAVEEPEVLSFSNPEGSWHS